MKTTSCVYAHTLLATCFASACSFTLVQASGKITVEERAVSGFDRVALCGKGKLVLAQSETETVKIEAEDNLLPDIVTEVQGSTLKIGLGCNGERVHNPPGRPPTYRVTLKTLRGLSVSGPGRLTADTLRADAIELQVSGSGHLKVGELTAHKAEARVSGSGGVTLGALNASVLKTNIAGSGTVRVAGKVPAQQIDISGSGTYEAADATSQTTTASISGSGEVTVWTNESLNVEISGSGKLRYYGEPQLTPTPSGSSAIQALGVHPSQQG
jgi:hypothetical protein